MLKVDCKIEQDLQEVEALMREKGFAISMVAGCLRLTVIKGNKEYEFDLRDTENLSAWGGVISFPRQFESERLFISE